MVQRPLLPCVCGALLLVSAGCGGGAPAAGHGILFVRARGRVQRICLWRPGSPPHPLGPSADYVESPAWSPDGKSIVFADERGGWDDPMPVDIYVMQADGADVKRVTYDSERPNVFRADQPSWSPDGSRIVFERDLNGPYNELVLVSVRTGHERTLPAHGGDPAWGKPGIAYVYAQPRSQSQRIMILRSGSRHPSVLARTHSLIDALAWSPSSVLAVLENRNRIVLYTASGRQVGQLMIPGEASGACGVAWSRDGTRLLLSTGGQKRPGFWTTTPTGRRWRRLPLPGQTDVCGGGVSWR